MAVKKIVRQQVASSKCKEVDITIPSLSDSEYIAMIKEHYKSLASKVVIAPDGTPELSRELKALEDFAMDIRVYKSLGVKLPFGINEIETCFLKYKTDIMPKVKELQKFYRYNRNLIAFNIISENWSDEQKRLFSEGYLPEFRKFIHKDIGKFEDLHDYGDFQPRGYEVTDNPKGKLAFRISKDGFKQPVYIHCELEPQAPERFKKVGYYGYDGYLDTYKLKSFNVVGPLNVNWDNILSAQDKRDIFDFTQNAIKQLGVIRFNCGREVAIDRLFPGTKKTVLSSIEHQKKNGILPSL